MAFVSALFVVKPFIRFIARSGFAPFAWYRLALGGCLLVAVYMGWL
jgi:undecaprenyl-diphosphatase